MNYLADTAEAMLRVDMGELDNAARMILEAKDGGNTVWVVGNGGSAATAEHLSNDLLKLGGVRAISVSAMFPTVLAFGNDCGWEKMYAEALKVLRRNGDVLVAISCGGRSPNVVEAAKLFHHDHLIVLTGNTFDSPMAQMEADAKVFVYDGDIRVQEDVHLAVCHWLAGAVK